MPSFMVVVVTHKATIGANWTLSEPYFKAALRAALLEGEVWVAGIEEGETQSIRSVGLFFGPGRIMFGT